MSPYTPNEPEVDLFYERMFIAGDFTCGLGYGMQVVFYAACAVHLWQQRKVSWRNIFLFAYITLLFVVETILAADQARTVQVVYIDNRDYPGGPWAYFLATQTLAINVIFYASAFVLTFLSDALVLWRSWTIWRAVNGLTTAILVNIFPAILVLASFVMGTLWTLESSSPNLSMYSKVPLAFGTAYYTLSLGVNVILTILISACLLVYRRKVMKFLPEDHARYYISMTAIFVESAALYSIFAVVFLVTYAVNNPVNQVFMSFTQSAQQIATYLIIYRLAGGKALDRKTLSQPNMSTVRFGTAEVHHADTSGHSGTYLPSLGSETDSEKARNDETSH